MYFGTYIYYFLQENSYIRYFEKSWIKNNMFFEKKNEVKFQQQFETDTIAKCVQCILLKLLSKQYEKKKSVAPKSK